MLRKKPKIIKTFGSIFDLEFCGIFAKFKES